MLVTNFIAFLLFKIKLTRDNLRSPVFRYVCVVWFFLLAENPSAKSYFQLWTVSKQSKPSPFTPVEAC